MRGNSNADSLFILIFVLIIIIVTSVIIRNNKRKRCTVLVKATVTDIDSHMSRKSKVGGEIRVYSPILSYEWNGWTRTVQDRVYSSWSEFEIGDEVEIYINPDNPGEFIYK